MKRGMQVGLGHGHIVLGGEWGHSYTPPNWAEPPIFGPYLLWPNRWMDQDATWYGGGPQALSPGDCVLDVDPASYPQKGRSST